MNPIRVTINYRNGTTEEKLFKSWITFAAYLEKRHGDYYEVNVQQIGTCENCRYCAGECANPESERHEDWTRPNESCTKWARKKEKERYG